MVRPRKDSYVGNLFSFFCFFYFEKKNTVTLKKIFGEADEDHFNSVGK